MGAKINNLMQKYGIVPGSGFASGGRVRTHYQTGGGAELDPEMRYGEMYPSTSPRRPLSASLMPIEGVGEGALMLPPEASASPSASPSAAAPPVSAQMPEVVVTAEPPARQTQRVATPTLAELLNRYSGPSSYASDIREARGRAQSEATAFADLIKQMSERAESPTSRSEMYFRLAAAFGSPTRTGSIGETFGKVGEQMGEYTKGRRAEEAERRALGMRAQEARLGGTRQDLQTLLTLSQQESQERRAASTDLIGQANLAIAQARLGLEQARRGELQPDERRAVREGRSRVNSGEGALRTLEEALELNPRTYDRSLGESIQSFVTQGLSPNNPYVVATRIQANLLGNQVIEKLRASFGGNPTEGERNFLRDLSGVNSLSREERAAIIQRGINELRKRMDREQEEIQFITSGRSREITQE